jgi:hypothetical protein
MVGGNAGGNSVVNMDTTVEGFDELVEVIMALPLIVRHLLSYKVAKVVHGDRCVTRLHLLCQVRLAVE